MAGTQLAIERVIATLRAVGSAVPPELDSQLGELTALRAEIASANPAELVALERAVNAQVAEATRAAQQAKSAAEPAAASEQVLAAADASRRAVQSTMEYTRNLHLQFASEEDERGYREREAERAAYIAAQQAKHTPEGDLNAAGGAVGQMVDARAHGAGGAEFERRWSELVETTAALREKVRAQGGSTKEFDEHLRADLRRIMKAKGLTDAEIDARFAANPDPLEAAKAIVSGGDLAAIQSSSQQMAESERPQFVRSSEENPMAGHPARDPSNVLRAAGVIASETRDAHGHGLTVDTSDRQVVRSV